ncbi:inhibitor of the pro-sigma K processing machinery [Pelagirhabdus alkalitolerans]|uniref:Inhibitor of the pro-sigma K processing machinery n=1 Tax=Pelagirhabdus alkalitolerans TaxID=1612202 RepID=A0A1G6NH22_9BACI|nr:pro-sigmaK processing inhibitor BofA family protein [Pelagirhabdus alkalitolerans]SDC66724.1 inhibitor of the pro-sigma K processing machinery [Pelagirhabdus alkalitolerans]
MNTLSIALIMSLVIGFIVFKMKLFEWLFKVSVKLIIGAMALFILNIVSGYLGVYIPINLFTSLFVGLLGIPGIIALGLFQFFIV